MSDLTTLTDRDLELAAVVLHSASQSIQWGATLRNKTDLDPLAEEYLVALQHVEEIQHARVSPTCGDVWMPDEPKIADITCDRKLGKNGKHTGKHTHYDPETGKPQIQWWGGKK